MIAGLISGLSRGTWRFLTLSPRLDVESQDQFPVKLAMMKDHPMASDLSGDPDSGQIHSVNLSPAAYINI
jgi:hypothetical protein